MQGEIILEEGEQSRDLYLLASGRVQVVTVRDVGAGLPSLPEKSALAVHDGSATSKSAASVTAPRRGRAATQVLLDQNGPSTTDDSDLPPNEFGERILAEERAGSYFGEVAFSAGRGSPRTARVRAAGGKVTVMQLPYEAFESYPAPQHFALMQKMLADVTHKLLSSKLRLGKLCTLVYASATSHINPPCLQYHISLISRSGG